MTKEILVHLFLTQKKNLEKKLDQKITAGCGNYLRADALYLAEINPYTLGKDLPEEKIKELWSILNQLGWFFYDKDQGIKNKIIN